MVTLRVFLLDLLVIVDQGDRKWVLLPDAVGRGQTPGDPVEPHFPMFLFERDDLRGGDWPELKRRLGLQGFRPGTAWLLDHEEIVFPDPAQPGFDNAFNGNPAGELPANADEARSLSWMPDLARLAPGNPVDPACLASPVRTAKLIARTSFTGGSLRTAAFTKIESEFLAEGEIVPFEFKAGPDAAAQGPRRALADRLVMEVPIDGDAVTVKTVPFDGGRRRQGRLVRLTPNEQGIVNVLLANVSPATPDPTRPLDRGPHFHAYYDLFQNPVPRADQRIPFVFRNGHVPGPPALNPLDVEIELPALFKQAFRNPIGVFENRICTVPQMTA